MYKTKVIVEEICPIDGMYDWATTLMESFDDGITWQRVRHLDYFTSKEKAEKSL